MGTMKIIDMTLRMADSVRDVQLSFKEKLEEFFGVTITEDAIREAIKLRNEERKAAVELLDVMKADPVPVMGYDLFKVVYGASFTFDREQAVKQLRDVKARIMEEAEENAAKIGHKPRIIVTGCPMGGATEKIARIIEENGGVVVGYENCTGIKNYTVLQVSIENTDCFFKLQRTPADIGDFRLFDQQMIFRPDRFGCFHHAAFTDKDLPGHNGSLRFLPAFRKAAVYQRDIRTRFFCHCSDLPILRRILPAIRSGLRPASLISS